MQKQCKAAVSGEQQQDQIDERKNDEDFSSLPSRFQRNLRSRVKFGVTLAISRFAASPAPVRASGFSGSRKYFVNCSCKMAKAVSGLSAYWNRFRSSAVDGAMPHQSFEVQNLFPELRSVQHDHDLAFQFPGLRQRQNLEQLVQGSDIRLGKSPALSPDTQTRTCA